MSQFTYQEFIAAFPEFTNQQVFPQAQVSIWTPVAYEQLNSTRFGNQLGLAAMLFVAHNLVLSARAAASVNAGQIPGEGRGVVATKTVGPVSVTYDAASITSEGAGMWNSTSYGQRLYKLMQAYGGGPLYAPGPRRFAAR